jgi:hypothetical protein
MNRTQSLTDGNIGLTLMGHMLADAGWSGVWHQHDFDELISIKETICTYGEENGRIVLMSVEEIYFTPGEIEEHMNEIYENW